VEEQAKDKGFKVDDRRRFSAEGELRPEHQGTSDAEEKTAPPPSAGGPAAERAAPRGAAPAGGAPIPEMTFTTFVVSLSTEALALLGEIPDPASGQRRPDLGAAQQVIDIIGILRDKTRGNLDSDEAHLIEAILFDLRMKYVEIARQPADR
jgi:hypothetical protein